MFQQWRNKRKARIDALNKAREGFTSWLDISKSPGWKAYQERIDKRIDVLREQMETNDILSGEDLKRLQLALKAYKEIQRIPKELEENARGGK